MRGATADVRSLVSRALAATAVAFVLAAIPALSVVARGSSLFIAPAQVTIHSYVLDANGAIAQPPMLCQPGQVSYGCTADTSRGFPYSTNPSTISINADYLLDVIPQEMDPAAFHPTAIASQAVAARSYIYYHIHYNSAVNNSTQYQAFLPYKFESLNLAANPDNPANPCLSGNLNNSQSVACMGVASGEYLTAHGQDIPARAEFFADVPLRTLSHPQQSTLYPYLKGVEDPISLSPPAITNGHGFGMSQNGAARWARGNSDGLLNSAGTPWSVSWSSASQILAHYYTAVDIRDAAGTIITHAAYRWNVLGLAVPGVMVYQTYPVTVRLQNTSATTWNGDYQISYRWRNADGSPVAESYTASRVAVGSLAPGQDGSYLINVQPPTLAAPRVLVLEWDMLYAPSSYPSGYWFGDSGWPRYRSPVCVGGPCRTFVPLAVSDSSNCSELIQNGGFESGVVPWTFGGSAIRSMHNVHTGSFAVWLGSDGANLMNDWVSQVVTIPWTATSVSFSYSWYLHSQEGTQTAQDILSVRVFDANGQFVQTIDTIDNTSSFPRDIWVGSLPLSLAIYRGQTIRLDYHFSTNESLPTSLYMDDVSVRSCQ